MTIHTYTKLAAVATMVVAAVLSARHRDAPPVLVTMVTESVVMTPPEATPKPAPVDHSKPHVERVAKVDHIKVEQKPAAKVERTLAPWTLPWSCSKVKWAANTFSQATLNAMRIAGGVAPLTAAEKKQAQECIEGKRS